MTKAEIEKQSAKHLDDDVDVVQNEALAEILAWSPEQREEAERKLVRKMDFRLIPWMTLLYLMSFLDRKCHFDPLMRIADCRYCGAYVATPCSHPQVSTSVPPTSGTSLRTST
jgi:hypothetical protein